MESDTSPVSRMNIPTIHPPSGSSPMIVVAGEGLTN